MVVMRGHAKSALVQAKACEALSCLTYDDDKTISRAGNAGTFEALVAAMRGHAGSLRVQEKACAALYSVIHGQANMIIKAANAGDVGAVGAVVTSIRRHGGSLEVHLWASMMRHDII